MLDNYPPGAASDPNAPYNQPSTELVDRYVDACISFKISDEFPYKYPEDLIKQELSEKAEEILKEKLKDLNDLIIDNIEVYE